jgi:hypothetical protein
VGELQVRSKQVWVFLGGASLVGLVAMANWPEAETIDPWPFKMDEVTLSCEKNRVFVTAPDGRRYAVNGTAKSFALEPRVETIQAYYDTSAVIRRGTQLCETGSGSIPLVAPVRAAPPDPGQPSFRKQAMDRSLGYFATFEATTVIDGQRPELTFVCRPGQLLGLQLNLIRAPETAPPLRGVFGTIEIDANSEVRAELAWGLDGRWMLRAGNDRERDLQDDRIARAMLAGQQVTFRGPSGFIAHSSITWALAGFGEQFDGVRRTCGEKATAQAVPTSIKQADKIEVRISAETNGQLTPLITGRTNLPDEAELMVTLRRPSAYFSAGDTVPVTGGSFKAGPFNLRGQPLPAGEYEVSISMSIARNQPKTVQAVIGDKGQNLTGSYVTRSNVGDLDNYVSYTFPLVIADASEPSLPRGWKQITTDFCTAMQAGGVCGEFDMRVDTEKALESKFGYKVRGEPGTDVGGTCMKALIDFKGSRADCKRAWEDYGCQGQKHARLLQQSHLAGGGRILCKY